MSSQFNKASKATRAAETDLVEADAMAGRRDLSCAQQMARAMRKEAKRRRSKAQRRQARQICDPDLIEDFEDFGDFEDYPY